MQPILGIHIMVLLEDTILNLIPVLFSNPCLLAMFRINVTARPPRWWSKLAPSDGRNEAPFSRSCFQRHVLLQDQSRCSQVWSARSFSQSDLSIFDPTKFKRSGYVRSWIHAPDPLGEYTQSLAWSSLFVSGGLYDSLFKNYDSYLFLTHMYVECRLYHPIIIRISYSHLAPNPMSYCCTILY